MKMPLIALMALLTGPAMAADPEAHAAIAAEKMVAMLDRIGARIDAGTAEADLRRIFAALGPQPLLAEKLPQALAQGADLAVNAGNAASRAVFYDLTRDMLITGVGMAGAPGDSALLSAWEGVDPLRFDLVSGQGMADSDIAGLALLNRLSGDAPDRAGSQMQAFWDGQAGNPVNRVFPTRMQAWADGAAQVWDQLSDREQALIADALDNEAIPPKPLLKKVIGTDDMIGWLAAVNVPMSQSEKSASPELLHFMGMGAFAGPLKQPLIELVQMAGQGGGGGLSGAATQLMRLNNWSAMTGEMHSWESYRYMTQGY